MSFKCDLIQRFLSYQGSETNILLIWVFFFQAYSPFLFYFIFLKYKFIYFNPEGSGGEGGGRGDLDGEYM